MHINPNLFFLARPPALIIWNYKTHEQFELNPTYSQRLMELIHDISKYDSKLTIDSTFSKSSIIQELPAAECSWGWDDISKIFHIGTKDLLDAEQPTDSSGWADHYLTHCRNVLSTNLPDSNRFAHLHAEDLITLPRPLPNEALIKNPSLENALLRRKTCRSYFNKSISLEDISTLLYLSLGHLKERDTDTSDLTPVAFRARRTSPSGGGLSSSEGYLYAYNVRDLNPGIYYYHPSFHGLRLIHRLSEPLGNFLQGQHFADNLPFGLFITSRFDKLWWKYPHSRAYRVALIEAGHIAQTTQLIATAMGLNTWLSAALNDSKVEKALGIQDLREQLVLFVGGGYSDGKVFSAEFERLLMPHTD
ncbi:dehydrogenase [Pseudomonas fluorescens]|nr:dehydrogenase [Pseudomonas fluorescens]OPB04204.1 dehydrogenase [Pseudomonas fluorescens]OPB15503.1 dehydrogenase [Pseudomonas fluorescens]